MNVLIYDQEGGHFNNVRNSFLFTSSGSANIIRDFGKSESELLTFCLDNDIKIAIIPLSSRQYNFSTLMDNGITVFVAGKGFADSQRTQEQFGPPISVGGGNTETLNFGEGAEVYTQALNFSNESQRNASSYACGALAGMIENSGLIGKYTPYEIKQIVRQNASNYPNHSINQGFGKVTSIEEPESVDQTLDIMHIQTFLTPTNLVFIRFTDPKYYSGTPKVFIDGAQVNVPILYGDNENWALIESTGFTNQTDFTVTYFEKEIYNTGNIGANPDPYILTDQFPVFNETLVSDFPNYVNEGDFKNYIFTHRENSNRGIIRYDVCQIRVYQNSQLLRKVVTRSNVINSVSTSLQLEDNQEYQITFQVFANGELYPETDPYTYNTSTGEFTFDGEIFDAQSFYGEPEVIEEPEDPEPPEEDEEDEEIITFTPEKPQIIKAQRQNNKIQLEAFPIPGIVRWKAGVYGSELTEVGEGLEIDFEPQDQAYTVEVVNEVDGKESEVSRTYIPAVPKQIQTGARFIL